VQGEVKPMVTGLSILRIFISLASFIIFFNIEHIINKQKHQFKQINRNFKLAAYKQKQGAKWAAFVSSPILVVELLRSATTGIQVSIACLQSSECIQQEQVTQLQLHLHFISVKRVHCLHHFLAQYFTHYQLLLLQ